MLDALAEVMALLEQEVSHGLFLGKELRSDRYGLVVVAVGREVAAFEGVKARHLFAKSFKGDGGYTGAPLDFVIERSNAFLTDVRKGGANDNAATAIRRAVFVALYGSGNCVEQSQI